MLKSQTLEANINKMGVNVGEWIQPVQEVTIIDKKPQKPSISHVKLDKKTTDMINKFVDEDFDLQNDRLEHELGLVEPKKKVEIVPKTTSIAEKQRKIWKIEQYIHSNRFGDFIQKDLKIDYTRDELDAMEDKELTKILERIRIQLDNKNLDQFYNSFAKTSSILVEKSMSNFYNIDGFTDNLFQNGAFLDGLERMKIDSGPLSYVPPSIQLSYAIISTAYMTHQLNSMNLSKSRKKVQMEAPTAEEMKQLDETLKSGDTL